VTRRDLLRRSAVTTLAPIALDAQEAAPAPASPQLNRLGGMAPPLESGVSWGVPWPRGAVSKLETFSLTAGGAALPLQQWPLAYWPDGSIKWTGFATVAQTAAAFRLVPGTPVAPPSPIKLTESATAVDIDTGKIQARIPKSGAAFINSITMDGRALAGPARLVCMLEGGASFTSNIQKVTVEQSGPVRATLKIEGVHKSESGARMAAVHRAPLLLCGHREHPAHPQFCFRRRRWLETRSRHGILSHMARNTIIM
jgi:hypothetical protein